MKAVGYTKQLLAAAAMVAAGVGGAAAADLPVKAPPPPVAWTWTGFYWGVNLGWGWASTSGTSTLTSPAGTVIGVVDPIPTHNGVIGGTQAGYNWQTGPFVLGVEGDFDGSAQNRADQITCFGLLLATCSLNATTGVDWFATARGRVGFAFDRWLVYATGGAAWQHVSENLTFTGPPGQISTTFGNSTTRGGWVVGAGVETAFWDNFTIGAEYLYINTGTYTSAFTVVAGSPFTALPGVAVGSTVTTSVNTNNNIVRLRAGYKF